MQPDIETLTRLIAAADDMIEALDRGWPYAIHSARNELEVAANAAREELQRLMRRRDEQSL